MLVILLIFFARANTRKEYRDIYIRQYLGSVILILVSLFLAFVLPVEASIKQLFIDAKTLREYFGIKYSKNLGNILNQFTYRLGQSVPKTMPDMKTLTDFEKGAIVRSLSISDSEDPNKIYCIGVRRNPEGKFRSEFNSDKTKVLRKTLYDKFADDHSISFCYSADQTKEKRDEIIYKLFANE